MRISDWSSDVCSSDLRPDLVTQSIPRLWNIGQKAFVVIIFGPRGFSGHLIEDAAVGQAQNDRIDRSEEHTSELQSLMRISYAVFCLKKKKKKTTIDNETAHTYTKQKYTTDMKH